VGLFRILARQQDWNAISHHYRKNPTRKETPPDLESKQAGGEAVSVVYLFGSNPTIVRSTL
jgi:hypothetical protein